uniref:Uncharacterized protein n=1 Tax=Oryza punctata TaxID=4537 RepID=A0A0E0JY69_ORYPU
MSTLLTRTLCVMPVSIGCLGLCFTAGETVSIITSNSKLLLEVSIPVTAFSLFFLLFGACSRLGDPWKQGRENKVMTKS